MSSLMELVPQSMAAISDTGAPVPPGTEQRDDLVAERVHARPGGERLGRQRMQALDPVGHPAGRDLLDLGDVAEARLGRRGRPGGRAAYAAASSGSSASRVSISRIIARALEGPDRRGDARAGEVVRRGERRAVGQSWLGDDHVGQSARTAVADGVGAAGRAAQLGLDRGQVRRGDRLSGRCHRGTSAAWCAGGAGWVAGQLDRSPLGGPPRGGGLSWPRCAGRSAVASRGEGLAVLADHDVRRLAGHQVAEARPRLLLDVRRVLPALLLALELVDARLARRRSGRAATGSGCAAGSRPSTTTRRRSSAPRATSTSTIARPVNRDWPRVGAGAVAAAGPAVRVRGRCRGPPGRDPGRPSGRGSASAGDPAGDPAGAWLGHRRQAPNRGKARAPA